jgi:hypothetical protein
VENTIIVAVGQAQLRLPQIDYTNKAFSYSWKDSRHWEVGAGKRLLSSVVATAGMKLTGVLFGQELVKVFPQNTNSLHKERP